MSAVAQRVFEDVPAVRHRVPLLIGLVGPSGSGKTYSALRLATGIQRVVAGDIFVVDSEANRSLHYADSFRFRHVPFGAPFDALSYLAAVEHCVAKGAKTVIVDSTSHLHEGPGGTLEMHEAECQRLQEAWRTSRDKVQMSAWQRPKAELRRFLNRVLQMDVNTIWCFRAKDKIKVIPGKNPEQLGFMPIASDEMIYEMTVNCLLHPNAGGVPSWHPVEMGEKAIVKLPQQFQKILDVNQPLSEDIGEQLAKWAAGSKPPHASATSAVGPAPCPSAAAYDLCSDTEEFEALEQRRSAHWKAMPPSSEKQSIKSARDAAAARLGIEH